MRLKKTNEIAETDENVDCKTANFFSNETFFFIINFSLRVLAIASKIIRRFRETDIAIKIRKNHYNEKHTEKKNDFLKKIIKKTIESTDFSIIKKLLTFYRCQRHHNSLIEEKKHFHRLIKLFFNFFA